MNGDIGSVFMKEHKDLVEKNKDYKYIATYKKNNRLFIKVKHLYCNKIYTIRLDGWCQGSKPCGNYSRVGCCGSYENSLAYYIEVKLGLNLDDLWNWEKNNENNVNPYYISYGSTKKIWLYCLEHDYHNYDRYDNKIGYQTTCNNFSQGKRCGYCNGTSKSHWKDSLGYLYDDIAKMIAIPENNLTFEDTFEITPKSGRKFYIKCLRCGKVCSDKKDLHHIQNYGFSCNYCSDGISIPEKFMSNILKQLDINFQTQLNKSIFKWCGEYKYDFYIPVFNMIIETHGRQHYEDCRYNDYDVEKQKKIDEDKRTIALKNNIQNYIVVNCQYSTLTWLKENIEKELSSSFNLSNMDWKLAWRECQNSLCMRALELHKKGYKNKRLC